jgi:hypothetical protein
MVISENEDKKLVRSQAGNPKPPQEIRTFKDMKKEQYKNERKTRIWGFQLFSYVSETETAALRHNDSVLVNVLDITTQGCTFCLDLWCKHVLTSKFTVVDSGRCIIKITPHVR